MPVIVEKLDCLWEVTSHDHRMSATVQLNSRIMPQNMILVNACLRANFFDKMPLLPLSLDVFVSVKFPPREVTFSVSGVFQRGQL